MKYDEIDDLKDEIDDLRNEIDDFREELDGLREDDNYIPRYNYRILTPEEREENKRKLRFTLIIILLGFAAVFIPLFAYIWPNVSWVFK